MERWMTVADIMARYGCSPKTARKYIRMMGGAVEPYGAFESQVEAWDRSRMVRKEEEAAPKRKRKSGQVPGWHPGMIIPMRRD